MHLARGQMQWQTRLSDSRHCLLRGWLAKKCGLLRHDTTPSSRNFIAISMVLSSPRAVDPNQWTQLAWLGVNHSKI